MKLARIETMEPRTLLAAALTPDASFGGGRVVLESENLSAFGQAVLPLPEGDILVAGRAINTATQSHGVVVARYNADGSPDPALGGRGWVFTDQLTRAWAIEVQPDGNILVAGAYYPFTGRSDDDFASVFAVVRLKADGSPDASFDADGQATVDIPGALDTAFDMALDPQGNIVLVGSALAPGPVPSSPAQPFTSSPGRALYVGARFLAVARLTPSGAPDVTFDGDGIATPDAPGDNDRGKAVAVTPAGEIFVGGSSSSGAFVVKLKSDGSADPSFGGGDGAVAVPRMEGVEDLLVRPQDGDVVAVGNAVHDPPVDPRDPEAVANTPARLALARLNADGSPDAGFGSGGVVVADAKLTYYYFIDLAVRELPDGTFAVGGADYHYAYEAVFSSGGEKQKAAVSDRTDFGGHPAVAIQADGKLLVVGHTMGTNPYAIVTARYVLADVPPPEDPKDPPTPVPAFQFIGDPVVRRGRFYTFRVLYPAAAGLDPRSFGDVAVTGPSGAVQSAQLVRLARFRRGGEFRMLATYRYLAPGGVFDAPDAGRYTVRLPDALSALTRGIAPPPGGVLGEFEVHPPRVRPVPTSGRRR